MVADILQAAYQERQRLESLLRSNADFQKLEEVRRIIDLYEQPDEQPLRNPAPADPIVHPTPLGSTPFAQRVLPTGSPVAAGDGVLADFPDQR